MWLKTLDANRGSKLTEVAAYAQEGYLQVFLDHGTVKISNHFAENAIRPFAVGRKNWKR